MSCCLTACKPDAKAAAPPTPPPAQVEVYVTKRQNMPAVFSHTGQIEPSQTVEVRTRVKGILLQQAFTEGTSVTQGQFLYRIDPRSFEADVRIGAANANQAKVTLLEAQRNLARTKELAVSRTVSKENLDEAITKHETAVAAVDLAQANLYKAQLELSYTTVTAPIAGRIGRSEKKPGDLMDTTENSLLCTITRQDPAYVHFFVSEREMLEYNRDVKEGRVIVPKDGKLKVSVTLLDGTNYEHSGEINFLDVKIDPKTGTALVRAELPNPDGILVPGQFVKANVHGVTRPNQILLPQRAVQIGMQGTYVYVADNAGKVEMRPIDAGEWQGNSWVAKSGLEADEQVIVSGLLKVRPGAEVKVTTVTRALDQATSETAKSTADTSTTAAR